MSNKPNAPVIQMAAPRQADAEPKSLGNAWLTFVNDNRISLEHIHTSEREARNQGSPKSDDEAVNQALTSFLACLTTPTEIESVPYTKDLQNVRKITDAIMEAQKDETLTESETLELLRFIIGKFVERRFARALRHMLPVGESKRWFYTSRKVLQ
jgi:hypothetical protein